MKKLQLGVFGRHIFNSIRKDNAMFIEATYMWNVRGQACEIGVGTVCHQQMVKWPLRFVLGVQVSQILSDSSIFHHNKLMAESKQTRIIVRPYATYFIHCICGDTSEHASHPYGALVNIVKGQTSHPGEIPDNVFNQGQWKRSNQRYASGGNVMSHDSPA